jgi:hypothetical protein
MCDGSLATLAAQTEACSQGWVARGKWQTVQAKQRALVCDPQKETCLRRRRPASPKTGQAFGVHHQPLQPRRFKGSRLPRRQCRQGFSSADAFLGLAILLCSHSVDGHGLAGELKDEHRGDRVLVLQAHSFAA